MEPKPNCYECKWRGSVPGDAHSCCRHPSNASVLDDPMMRLLSILASGRKQDIGQLENELNVRGNKHGISHGWFNWPFNFDPTWLEQCNGFTAKEG